MPNIAQVLKEEISRIARRDARAVVTPIQRRIVKLERTAAEFRKRVGLLEKEARQLNALLQKMAVSQSAPPAPEENFSRLR